MRRYESDGLAIRLALFKSKSRTREGMRQEMVLTLSHAIERWNAKFDRKRFLRIAKVGM